jgi:6-phosphogluconate dehydrogenase
VFARCLSSIREERGRAAKRIVGPGTQFQGDKKAFIDKLEQVTLFAFKGDIVGFVCI